MPQLTQFNALMPVQAFQAGRDQRNQRIGGEFQNALMEGNLDQARTLAQRSGDADMIGQYRSAIEQMNEQQRADALRRTQVLGGAAEWALQNVPPGQIDTYVRQQLAPQLAAAGYDISEYLPNGMPITQDALGTFVAMAQGAAGELTAYLDRNPGTREIGQYDALVQQRGGQQNVTLNEQGSRALDEQNRSNMRDEELRGEANSIDRMNAGTNAFNAQTNRYEAETGRARLEEDRRQFDQTEARLRTNAERGDPPSQSDIRALRGEFEDEFARPFEEAQDQFLAMADAARDQTGASDIALVFSFFKTIDPASTVREGEFASAANAMGLPARIAQQLERLDNGQLLTPQARQDLISAAENSIRQRYQTVQNAYQRYESLARSSNIDPQMVVRQTSRLPEGRVNVIGENAPTASPPQTTPADDLTNRAGRYLVQ